MNTIQIDDSNRLVATVTNNGYQGVNSLVMDSIRVFGTDRNVAMVTVNDEVHVDWDQNSQTRVSC